MYILDRGAWAVGEGRGACGMKDGCVWGVGESEDAYIAGSGASGRLIGEVPVDKRGWAAPFRTWAVPSTA